MPRCVLDRRVFILAGASAASTLAAGAEQSAKVPTVGILGSGTPAVQGPWWAGCVERLRILGWIEAHNVAIQFRWAESRSERYDEIAAEFIQMKVDVITTSGTPAVAAAKRATSTIPIVFAAAGDPVGTGLVASPAQEGCFKGTRPDRGSFFRLTCLGKRRERHT